MRVLMASEHLEPDPDDPHSPASAQSVMRSDFDTASTPNHLICLGNERFAEGGDSGSLVVDENRNAVGLVAISAAAAHANDLPPKAYHTFACHIYPVLDLLKICLPTSAGTTHGSCSATDGSGLTSAPAPQTATPTGTMAFLGAGVASARLPREDAQADISEEERSRMLAFRDALVASSAGRELHDTFVRVRRELGYLVRKSRPVKVVWHRNRGPAYLAHILNHLRGDSPTVPHDVSGISRGEFLTRMGAVLSAHGSIPLRDAIARYRTELLPVLLEANDIEDCLRALSKKQAHGGKLEGDAP